MVYLNRRSSSGSHGAGEKLRRGFTLIEILVVVVLLGILASIVIAHTLDVTDDAKRSVFLQNLLSFEKGLSLYMNDQTGAADLENPSSGTCPAGLVPWVDRQHYEAPTPLGGVWDIETDANGVGLAVGVHFNGTGETRNDAYMSSVDDLVDDGDVTTGGFRRIADGRYYLILAEAP